MRRLLVLTLPLALTTFACDSGGDDGGDGDGGNSNILDLQGDAAAGETVFTATGCNNMACHGDGGTAGAVSLANVVPNLDDDTIINSVLDGKGGMPPQNLEDQQMADVLAWMRANF